MKHPADNEQSRLLMFDVRKVVGGSNETKRYVNHRVAALDPPVHVSPDGRHHARV
jgi:hypothetical protein